MHENHANAGRIHGQTREIGASEAYCGSCNQSYDSTQRTCPIDGAQLILLQDEADSLLGRVLDGRFEIKKRVGAGGMGTVYEAFQSSVGRNVAIKVIAPDVSRNRDTVKRFMREAQLASKLTHPNTVIVHDFGQTHDGIVYLVMEMIVGKTLRQILRANGPLPKDQLLQFAVQMCDALQTAHSIGIIHRDLKPANIMVLKTSSSRQQVKILDFGLAKSLSQDATNLSASNQRMGTPLYMSPEMLRCQDVTEQSDLYSLGCTLYEMASGRPPFVEKTTEAIFSAHLRKPPVPLSRNDLGPAADTILQLLAKSPRNRPVSAEAVRDVFERARTGVPAVASAEPVGATSGSTTIREGNNAGSTTSQHHKRPRRVALAAVLGLAIAVGTAGYAIARQASHSALLGEAFHMATELPAVEATVMPKTLEENTHSYMPPPPVASAANAEDQPPPSARDTRTRLPKRANSARKSRRPLSKKPKPSSKKRASPAPKTESAVAPMPTRPTATPTPRQRLEAKPQDPEPIFRLKKQPEL